MLIPYKFKHLVEDGKYQDISFDFPTAWEDLTFDQGCRIFTEWYDQDSNDVMKLLSILSGVEVSVWENAVGNVEADILPRLDFMKDAPELETRPVPKTLKIGEKEITLPKNIRLETFGQKVSLQSTINKSIGKPHDLFLIIPAAVAVYTYPQYFNAPLDSGKLKTFTELIGTCSFLDVYSAGKFFFLKSLKSSGSKPAN